MFHHFHGVGHTSGQGSISSDQFAEILDWLQQQYTILDAHDFQVAALSGTLRPKDICLSFDDALRCQFDLALPVLKSYKIKAFFFIYSAPLCGIDNYLEIFRDFRNSSFENIDEFYIQFFSQVKGEIHKTYDTYMKVFLDSHYLGDYPFYSGNDRWFRFLRDQVLGPELYHNTMIKMLDMHDYKLSEASKRLWMSENHVAHLFKNGHLIGLHSFSHPTAIRQLSRTEQKTEYQKNKAHLCKLLGKTGISSMSHPCGDYNADTLSVLNELGIKIGFNSSMAYVENRGPLEIPREDHANILKQLTK
ncbi:MAG: xylanase [Rhodospirillaceae bacterium]|nr:xylanase [Rhodospirillaceae bacterium]